MTDHLPPPEPIDDEPVDVFAVGADDRLLDELGQDLALDQDADDLAAVFLETWRASLHPHELPSPPTAPVVETPRRRAFPMIAAAAAIVALLLGTAAIGSRGAGPDDMLWPLTKLLWPDRIESVAAAENAGIALEQARLALADGEPPQASVVLTSAAVDISKVQPRDGRALLDEDYQELWTEVEGAMAPSPSSSVAVVPPSRGETRTSSSTGTDTRSSGTSTRPTTGSQQGSSAPVPPPPPTTGRTTSAPSTTPTPGTSTSTTETSTTSDPSTTSTSETTSDVPPTPPTTVTVDPTTPTTVESSSESSPVEPEQESPVVQDPQGDQQQVAPLLQAPADSSDTVGEN